VVVLHKLEGGKGHAGARGGHSAETFYNAKTFRNLKKGPGKEKKNYKKVLCVKARPEDSCGHFKEGGLPGKTRGAGKRWRPRHTSFSHKLARLSKGGARGGVNKKKKKFETQNLSKSWPPAGWARRN